MDADGECHDEEFRSLRLGVGAPVGGTVVLGTHAFTADGENIHQPSHHFITAMTTLLFFPLEIPIGHNDSA
jgi:hypothetical protein